MASANLPSRAARRPYRHKVRTLSQVNLDSSTGGILRDLNEFGIALQTVAPLTPDQQVHLRFDLPAFRARVEATGRIAWTDSWGQAGVQFLDLPPRFARLLKEWVFTQILSAAYLFSPCEALAVEGNSAEGATELLFSSSARAAIKLEPVPAKPRKLLEPEPQHATVRLEWCPVPMSVGMFAKLLDGLIQFCAVLLFAVVAMAIINILPSWPIALALTIGITAILMALYRLLFVYWIRSTPGQHLARLAAAENQLRFREEERFR